MAVYFTAFVLDSDAAAVGNTFCQSKFKGSSLYFTLQGSSIKCSNTNYAGIVVLDLIQVFTYYFLYECWSMTENLYNSDKKGE